MKDSLHDLICWLNAHLKGNREWCAKGFCSFSITLHSKLSSRFSFPFLPVCLLKYHKKNIKLSDLGKARIRRLFVEALRYMPEDHGFNSRLCLWKFSFT